MSRAKPQNVPLPESQAIALAEIADDLQRNVQRVPANKNPAMIYLNSLAPSGRSSVESQMRKLAISFGFDQTTWLVDMPWWHLRGSHFKTIRGAMVSQEYAPGTINLVLSILRSIARESFELGLMSAEDYERTKNIKNTRGNRLPPGRHLPVEDFIAIIRACCDNTLHGVRDYAIMSVMYGTGHRRSIIASLQISQYSRDTQNIRTLVKGNKEISSDLPPGTISALEQWLDVRGNEDGPLFCRISKNDKIDLTKPMSSQAIYKIFLKRVAQAGVKACTPHDLRRTFITNVLDMTGDVALAQSMAGHADPRTTVRYDRRGDIAKKKVIDRMVVPTI